MHEDYSFNSEETKKLLERSDIVKILVAASNVKLPKYFDDKLLLPTSLKIINEIVESSIAKKDFSRNSSINIKNYVLDKNEKKLTRDHLSIFLTEKEIQLLELLLKQKKPIEKDKILSKVWEYAADADTHTVETHIYRLRRKIKSKFLDESFILNNKSGYYL